MTPDMIDAIERWAADRGMSRAQAIRSAVTQAIFISRPAAKSSREKATGMAAHEIDKLSDSTASDEERQHRKRRLLKGPREFRDIRADRLKPKP
ncbi:MAG TPA: ribbon-helix-helix protein, CopG family [Xanthobacteraceae bacterium]|jgi:hypothetical protein